MTQSAWQAFSRAVDSLTYGKRVRFENDVRRANYTTHDSMTTIVQKCLNSNDKDYARITIQNAIGAYNGDDLQRMYDILEQKGCGWFFTNICSDILTALKEEVSKDYALKTGHQLLPNPGIHNPD